jgi:hypothetical protein
MISGIDGLEPRHKGSKPRTATPTVQAKICRKVQHKPQDGGTHWSVRRLATEMGVSKSSVQRILAQARLQPHRLERYMASNDPDFEAKAADIIGLYLEPAQHAAVFCVDEKTAIQSLDRLDPVLPLSPGGAERHGFEYYRHGILSLYAALDVKTGKVQGKTAQRHTSKEFIGFVSDLVSRARWAKEIHIVLVTSRHIRLKRSAVPCRSPQSALPLHSNLLVLAESGGTVVRKNPTRPSGTRYLHLGRRLDPENTEVHSCLRQGCQAIPLVIRRSHAQNHS